VKKAVIYEINTRQFMAQGSFAAACDHLGRLQTLGVDILWLMPIHPIGKKAHWAFRMQCRIILPSIPNLAPEMM
jgi:1,4-alpha-glucan branching enzyme